MSELFRCRRCNKVLIAEEYDSHLCTPRLSGELKIIEIDYMVVTRDSQNTEIMTAKGMDGTTYRLVKRLKRASDKVPFKPSDETLQGDDPTNTGQNHIAQGLNYI